jgi:hypothetical protein
MKGIDIFYKLQAIAFWQKKLNIISIMIIISNILLFQYTRNQENFLADI